MAIKLAKKSNLRLAQVAMLYPLTKGKHISVIFGSAKPDHIDDMVSLQHFKIDEIAMSQFVNPGTVRNNIVSWNPKLEIEKEHSNMKQSLPPVSISPKSSARSVGYVAASAQTNVKQPLPTVSISPKSSAKSVPFIKAN